MLVNTKLKSYQPISTDFCCKNCVQVSVLRPHADYGVERLYNLLIFRRWTKKDYLKNYLSLKISHLKSESDGEEACFKPLSSFLRHNHGKLTMLLGLVVYDQHQSIVVGEDWMVEGHGREKTKAEQEVKMKVAEKGDSHRSLSSSAHAQFSS